MALDQKKEISTLLKNLQHGLKDCTVDEINKALIEARENRSERKIEVDSVIQSVCKEFKITEKELIEGTSRECSHARQFAYCLLKIECGYSFRHISKKIFFKEHSAVQATIRFFNNLKPELKTDGQFLERYEKIKKNFNKIKNENSK